MVVFGWVYWACLTTGRCMMINFSWLDWTTATEELGAPQLLLRMELGRVGWSHVRDLPSLSRYVRIAGVFV